MDNNGPNTSFNKRREQILMGTINFTKSLVFIALFTIAILTFTINFASDNNSPIDISNDPELSNLKSDTETLAKDISEDSEDQYQSIIDSTIEPGSEVIQSSGPFAITPKNVISVVKNILNVGYVKIFGTGSGFGVFLTTFSGMLVFIIGLFVWKTWKGLPD